MKKPKKKLTIEDALRTIPGYRLPVESFKEFIPNFYCSNYSDAKRNLKCTNQCDNCKEIVRVRQEQTKSMLSITVVNTSTESKSFLLAGIKTEKVKCQCQCHKRTGVKHIKDCCDNGWIERPIK